MPQQATAREASTGSSPVRMKTRPPLVQPPGDTGATNFNDVALRMQECIQVMQFQQTGRLQEDCQFQHRLHLH